MHRLFTSASKNIHPVGLSLSNFSVFENEISLHIKQIIMLLQVVLGVTFSDDRGYIIELLVKMLTGFLSVDWWTLLRSSLNVLSGSPRIKKEGGWAFSGWDSSLPMQVTWVRALVRELDPTCHNKDWSSCVSQLRPSTAKWIIKKKREREGSGHALHAQGRLWVPSLFTSSVLCRSGQPLPGLPPQVIRLCNLLAFEMLKFPPISRLQKHLTLRRFCSSVFMISVS